MEKFITQSECNMAAADKTLVCARRKVLYKSLVLKALHEYSSTFWSQEGKSEKVLSRFCPTLSVGQNPAGL